MRDLLQHPGPLADNADQLSTGIGVGSHSTQQLGRPSARRNPKGNQRPVAVAREPGKQFVELVVGNVPLDPPDETRSEHPEGGALVCGSIGLW